MSLMSQLLTVKIEVFHNTEVYKMRASPSNLYIVFLFDVPSNFAIVAQSPQV